MYIVCYNIYIVYAMYCCFSSTHFIVRMFTARFHLWNYWIVYLTYFDLRYYTKYNIFAFRSMFRDTVKL